MVTEGKPDKPTLNEILASIRRITAEESAPDLHPFRLDTARETVRPSGDQPDEPEDFELPAMFRHDRRTKNQSTSDLIFGGSGALGGDEQSWALAPRLEAPALVEPVSVPMPTTAVLGSSARASEIPREMPSCLDRMVLRMGQSSAREPEAVAPKGDAAVPTAQTLAEPIPAPKTSAVPKATLRFNYLVGEGSVPGFESSDDPEVARAMPQGLQPQETSTPADTTLKDESLPANSAEGADFLRPLLRQWLDDNITRVLTQALVDTVARNNDQRS